MDSLGIGFSINGRRGMKYLMPKRIPIIKAEQYFESTSDKLFRIKLTPNAYRKQRLHSFDDKPLWKFESLVTGYCSMCEVQPAWVSSLVYDYDPDIPGRCIRNYEPEEDLSLSYKIQPSQYVVCFAAFHSMAAAARGMLILVFLLRSCIFFLFSF